jgi:hypothetical protein
MWVDIGTSERFRPLGRFLRGTKTEHALPHLPHPQPLAAILTENLEIISLSADCPSENLNEIIGVNRLTKIS